MEVLKRGRPNREVGSLQQRSYIKCSLYVVLQAIRRTIDKKTVEVYQLFNEELNLVKKEFNTKTVDLPPMYPIYAGSAAWARMLKRRIDRPMNVSSSSPTWSFCFIWGGVNKWWDSSSSQINCVKISNFLAKIFGFLAKIFKDLLLSCQDLQGFSKFLLRSFKTVKDLGKKMKGLWRSWQENERSLKILARKWKILEDLNKNFEDSYSKDFSKIFMKILIRILKGPHEDLQGSYQILQIFSPG